MVEFDRGHSLSSSVSRGSDRDRLPQVDDVVKSSNRSYQLVAILGEGGYGKVFHAVHNGRYVLYHCRCIYSKIREPVESQVVKEYVLFRIWVILQSADRTENALQLSKIVHSKFKTLSHIAF